MIEVKIKKLNDKAKMPFKERRAIPDYCYDMYATSVEEIAPNIYKYGTGIALQIVRPGYLAFDTTPPLLLSIDGRPRSSVWKTGMVLSNCEATIDEGYTGEIMFVFYHVMPDMPKYEVGDRIAQIKIGTSLPIQFVEVDKLDDTERSDGGYGSTGK